MVTISPSGNNVVVTVTVNIADIRASGVTAGEKRTQALHRAHAELSRAVEAHNRSDAEIDAMVTAVQAEAARLKAAKPTGSL